MKEHKSIRIDSELVAKLNELAEKEKRSFNNTLELIISKHFEEPDYSGLIQSNGSVTVKVK